MIKVGPAGSGGLGNIEGVKKVARMGLDCMEVEFTYGVRMSIDDACKVGALAKERGIILSVHAPYYINLASDDKAKIIASKKRILDSCERAHALGARCVVFHAGFYQKKTAEQTYDLINKGISEIQKSIKEKKWKVRLCPEITGKPSQFGSIEEIKRLMKDTGCAITVDFSHLYARQQGKIDYAKVLNRLPKKFHAHFSGITYTPKGERSHKLLDKRFFMPLAKAIKKHKPKSMIIINESPDVYGDAVKMKEWFK